MKLPIHQIDAFTSRPFEGNPAAVMPLDAWLPDALMQRIAAENNLSETAFLVHEPAGWRIRWFTPAVEVDLCGHATLAAAWLVLNELEPSAPRVEFSSRSGRLAVDRDGDELVLDFPSRPGRRAPELIEEVARAINMWPDEVYIARDIMAVVPGEKGVRNVAPDPERICGLPGMGVLVTGRSDHYDFVSRCFFPREGVPEDPVTGSAHCTLIPYWAERLGKSTLRAYQASARGGELSCALVADRVRIGGQAVKVMEGHFLIR